MSRVYNFSAGPANLPESVLEQAKEEMLNWHDSGMSVMEMSHRGAAFTEISEQAKQSLKTLMNIPDNYQVLFLQGGATTQFAAVPLNCLGNKTSVDYVNTGAWSKKAIKEAKKYAEVNVVASSEAESYSNVPELASWQCNPDAAYCHYTINETIGGLEFHWVPETANDVLVADASSTILSRPIDVSKFGLIYAGAQKNIGPAGLTIVIIRDDLLGHAKPETPSTLDFNLQAENDSKYNTPPTYAWYIAGLVFDWLLAQGGLTEIAKTNERKSSKLYQAIDDSDFYSNPIAPTDRSWMNVPFVLKNPELDAVFLAEAKESGLTELKGHRSVGGMRASIYNAMPEAGVDALINFMHDFEQRHG